MQGGVSLLSGTCSSALVPESQRACGLRVWPGACKLTVMLPKATGEITIANLRENPRLAVTMSQIPTHRTMQVKGTVFAIRDATDDEHAWIEAYAVKLRAQFAYLGIPEGVTRGLTFWPAWAVDMDIVHVFAQTPGPVAGAKMPLPSGPAGNLG